MIRIRRVQRNGSTDCINVPRDLLRALKWKRGDLVAVVVERGRLVARKIDEDALAREVAVSLRGEVKP